MDVLMIFLHYENVQSIVSNINSSWPQLLISLKDKTANFLWPPFTRGCLKTDLRDTDEHFSLLYVDHCPPLLPVTRSIKADSDVFSLNDSFGVCLFRSFLPGFSPPVSVMCPIKMAYLCSPALHPHPSVQACLLKC